MNIELRILSLADTDNIIRWRNSPEVKKNLFSQDDVTKEQHIDYFHKYVESGKISQFIIIVDGVECGTTFLKNIDNIKKEAEFGIFIGEADYRGKGISSIVTKKMIDYGFSNLNLVKIYLTVFEGNIAAIKSYIKAGFKQIEFIEKGYCRNGIFYNIIKMAIIR